MKKELFVQKSQDLASKLQRANVGRVRVSFAEDFTIAIIRQYTVAGYFEDYLYNPTEDGEVIWTRFLDLKRRMKDMGDIEVVK